MLALLQFGGCATVPGRGLWGEHARWAGWSAAGNAAIEAATDPMVWGPALGAAFFSLGDLDEDVSEWAARRQPVFGSDASEESDTLRSATSVAYIVTALAAPSGGTASEWTRNKGRGLIIDTAAIGITEAVTRGIKEVSGRERPDASNKHSFPSGHSSQSAARATLAARNLDYIAMPGWTRATLKTSVYGLAVGSAWGRVEGERHFPSDVLGGLALGRFVSLFFDRAIFAPDPSGRTGVFLETSPERLGLVFCREF